MKFNNLLPRVYMQRHTADTPPVLVHGNSRDEMDPGTATLWVRILTDYLLDSHLVTIKAKDDKSGHC